MSRALKSFFFAFLLSGVAACAPGKTEKPLATIGVVTDIHYFRDRETVGNRCYSLSAAKLAEAVRTFNEQKVNFTLSLGDTFDPDPSTYQDLEDVFAKLDKPVYKLLGNHDCIAPYGSDIQNAVLDALGIKKTYYTVAGPHKLRFIFIDGNDISLHSTAPGTPERELAERKLQELKMKGEISAQPYNGMLSETQFDWLRIQLDKAYDKGESVIVCGHMPWMPRNIEAALWEGERVDSLLQRYDNVRAVFAGHHHSGAYCKSGNIEHFTFKGMIVGKENHFAIARIYKDRIEVTDYPIEN